jgi:(p)ppGpp synthase/HD superfamily hydrolase
MNITRQAALIAAHAHRNQSYGNEPYFDAHLMLVAENAHFIAASSMWSVEDRENAETLAFLHDVYEDKLMSINAIQRDLSLATSVSNASWIARAVREISRKTDEKYENYIKRICNLEPPLLRRIILTVKAADLLANIACKPSDSLMKRYQNALGKVSAKLYDERQAINSILINSQL